MTRGAAELEAAVRATGLLMLDRPVLVMYSGGRDSACLLDLAVRITGAVTALHLNYSLRAGAVLDERQCAIVCEELGVPLLIRRPAGPERGGNLQAWARSVRYGAARDLAGEGDLASGHTASDQIETVLYRLISSPSRRALVGMAPRSGTLVRPLLSVTRGETTAYCAERGLPFRDDETNATPKYVRNRIRNELIPLLNDLHPGASSNVLELARVLADEREFLHAQVMRVVAGRDAVPLPELRDMPRGLSRLVLQDLADRRLDQPAAGVARRAEEILAMHDDARLDLPSGVRAVTEGGILRFERTPPLAR